MEEALEFGNEPEFMKEHRAEVSKAITAGRESVVLTATVDGYQITMHTDPTSGTPKRMKVERGQQVVCEYEYLEYRRDLPFQSELFEKPKGIAFTSP
ncbi:MAG: hypothetical protein QM765_41100 [Myxococcales bacterium]